MKIAITFTLDNDKRKVIAYALGLNPHKPAPYRACKDFLRAFGLSGLDDLVIEVEELKASGDFPTEKR